MKLNNRMSAEHRAKLSRARRVFLDAKKESEKKAIAADWAKVDDALVDRILATSRKVGRTADFSTFAAEFTLGANASSQRKTSLKSQIQDIEKKSLSVKARFVAFRALMNEAHKRFIKCPRSKSRLGGCGMPKTTSGDRK